MDIGLDKPIAGRYVAVTATRPHAYSVAAMRRFLEIRIVELERHGMTAGAKGIGRGGVVDRKTSHHTASTDHSSNQ